MERSLVVSGSISAIADAKRISIAESFLAVDTIIIVDVSGSMAVHDSEGGRQRYAVACEELQKLQVKLPGKIAVIAFSSRVEFVPGGVPPFLSGGTDLVAALRFVQVADGCVRFVLVSDGEPNDPGGALALAKSFRSKIDTVYVGPSDELRGRHFLERLAALSGGQHMMAEKAVELARGIERLMLAPRL